MSHLDEDLLRDALRDEAGTAAPADGAWDAVLAGAADRRARRRRIRIVAVASLSVAAAAAGVVGAASMRDEDAPKGIETVGQEGTQVTGALPKRVVVAVEGRLVVVDAADGSLEQVLRDSGSLRDGLAVTPTGEALLYVDFGGHTCEGQPPNLRVFDVARGGPVSGTVGHTPVLSSDGGRLAYGSCDFDDGGTGRGTLGVTDGADLPDDWGTGETGPAGEARWVEPVAFLPSGRLLVLVGEERNRAYTVDSDRVADAPPGEAPVYEPFPLPADVTAIALLDGGELAVARSLLGGSEVVAVDAETGEERGVLFDLPEWGVATMRADAGGRHLVITAVTALSSQESDPTMWRWARGDEEPTMAASIDGLADAAWWPDEAFVPVTRIVTDAVEPLADGEVVAVTRDGRLVVLDALDGTELREIDAGLQLSAEENPEPGDELDLSVPGAVTLAVSPDRKTVFHDGNPRAGCTETQYGRSIHHLTVDGAQIDYPGLGRWPAVSSDGTRLAYLRAVDCEGPAELVVRDLVTGAERWWDPPVFDDGRPEPELVGPLSWDADSRHVLIPLGDWPARSYLLADTESMSPTIEGEPIRLTGEYGPVGLHFIGATGDLAGIQEIVGDETGFVGGVDPATGEWNGVTYARINDPGAQIVAFDADASGEHWLVLTAEGELLRVDPKSYGTVPGFATSGIVAADW